MTHVLYVAMSIWYISCVCGCRIVSKITYNKCIEPCGYISTLPFGKNVTVYLCPTDRQGRLETTERPATPMVFGLFVGFVNKKIKTG